MWRECPTNKTPRGRASHPRKTGIKDGQAVGDNPQLASLARYPRACSVPNNPDTA